EVHRKNGGEKQKWMESIQRNSSSIQDRQNYFQSQQSKWTPKTNNIEGEWGHGRYSNPIGCSLSFMHDQFMFLKEDEISGIGGFTLSAPRPNLSMDKYNGSKSQK